ncbi:hypothetical protein ACIRSS_12660 [Amycolatopsis sp. NPDC101161]
MVLPETALHTAAIADRLDEAAGRPVLTATQVSARGVAGAPPTGG